MVLGGVRGLLGRIGGVLGVQHTLFEGEAMGAEGGMGRQTFFFNKKR